jgi:hypothetical protein
VAIEVKIPVDYWHWWTYWLPVVLIIGNLVLACQWWMVTRGNVAIRPRRHLTRLEICVRIAALFAGGWAVLLTLIHLVTPQLPVNGLTRELADEFLVRPEWKSDFAFVLQAAPERGKRLGALLQHVELANLQRQQFYKDLGPSHFQEFVLSPIVDTTPVAELDWRRTLWENFYPRVRRESEPLAGAQIVVRFLRQRVGISAAFPYRVGVETIWTQGMTDAAGFERIYVAALRSVGIAARLDSSGNAEIWNGKSWINAPRPAMTTLP